MHSCAVSIIGQGIGIIKLDEVTGHLIPVTQTIILLMGWEKQLWLLFSCPRPSRDGCKALDTAWQNTNAGNFTLVSVGTVLMWDRLLFVIGLQWRHSWRACQKSRCAEQSSLEGHLALLCHHHDDTSQKQPGSWAQLYNPIHTPKQYDYHPHQSYPEKQGLIRAKTCMILKIFIFIVARACSYTQQCRHSQMSAELILKSPKSHLSIPT